MKTLFPKQRESVEKLKLALALHGGALDSSHTGVGKTVIACHLAAEQKLPVAVICPKIVVPAWERELAETGIKPLFVTNYEKIKRGNAHLAKIGKKMFRWQLPEKTLIIWDECHKVAGMFSQNAQMLIASRQAGHQNLLLSATACLDPTGMRAIGYALGLHSLNKKEGNADSFFSWMKGFGCRQDKWRKWCPGPVWKLESLNRELYRDRAAKLTPQDLPTAFTSNHVIAEPLAFSATRDIRKFYADAGITPEILIKLLDGDLKPSPHVLVELLRARQLAETAKVPEIVDLATDAVVEGFSVAVFVAFTDSLRALQAALPDCAVIHGGQSAEERERDIQRFQSDRCRVIIANVAAGGVGVSLHDQHGNFPRMSLISPTFSFVEYTQMLGRIYRVGAKTPALQRVLIASGTVEEQVASALEAKRKRFDVLHAQNPVDAAGAP
jgi:superfamily II DNA or RNA helicase